MDSKPNSITSDSQRIPWIDILKGIAIFSVFLGHMTGMGHGTLSGIIHMWIYSFHMPLFFFLSGCVFSIDKYKDYKQFLIKKVKTIYFPVICFTFLSTIFDMLYYGLLLHNENYTVSKYMNDIVGILLQQRGKNDILWFLPCLFVAENIFYWIVKFGNKYGKSLIAICSIVLYLCGCTYIKLENTLLPWAVEISLVVLLFIGAGYLFHQGWKKQWLYNLSPWLSIVFLTVNIVIAYLNMVICKGEMIDLYANQIGNVILFPASAFCAIFGLIVCFKSVRKAKVLQYIGENSIVFYGMSRVSAAVPDFITFNITKMTFDNVGGVMLALICATLQCAATFPISELIRRKCKFIVGKF